jgi:hypothetical protein
VTLCEARCARRYIGRGATVVGRCCEFWIYAFPLHAWDRRLHSNQTAHTTTGRHWCAQRAQYASCKEAPAEHSRKLSAHNSCLLPPLRYNQGKDVSFAVSRNTNTFCSVSVRLHVCASPVLGTIETNTNTKYTCDTGQTVEHAVNRRHDKDSEFDLRFVFCTRTARRAFASLLMAAGLLLPTAICLRPGVNKIAHRGRHSTRAN